MNAYEMEELRLLQPSPRQRPETPPNPYLVDTAWLSRNLGTAGVVVLEVSLETSAAGTIPGAFALDWHRDLLDQQRRDIVSRQRLEQILQSAGANDDSTIVLYGDCHNWFAGFAAWVMEIHGVADVRLLDGGRALWLAEDRPLSRRHPAAPLGNLCLRESNFAPRAYLRDVLAVLETRNDAILVDVRSPDEFEGRHPAPDGDERALRAGHIPGAISLPWGLLVDADGRFRPASELRAIFAARGIDGRRPVITYCRIGERSGHTWFALTRLLGWEAQNYDGSWAEYGNAIGLPIACPAG